MQKTVTVNLFCSFRKTCSGTCVGLEELPLEINKRLQVHNIQCQRKKKKAKYFQHATTLALKTLFQHRWTGGHITSRVNKTSLVTSFILCIYSNT